MSVDSGSLQGDIESMSVDIDPLHGDIGSMSPDIQAMTADRALVSVDRQSTSVKIGSRRGDMESMAGGHWNDASLHRINVSRHGPMPADINPLQAGIGWAPGGLSRCQAAEILCRRAVSRVGEAKGHTARRAAGMRLTGSPTRMVPVCTTVP